MFKHVLIPTDGSELSQAAVVKGLRFAKEAGARVTGLHVTPAYHLLTFDTMMIEDSREQFMAESRAQADKRMAEFRRAATEEGVPFDAVIESSDQPYEAIVRVAAASGCDLILMASHGRRGMQALLLGSETQKVLAHTRISVLVVR